MNDIRIHCGSPGHPDDFKDLISKLNNVKAHIINRLEPLESNPITIFTLGWSYGAHYAIQDLMDQQAQYALLICPWFAQSQSQKLGLFKKSILRLLGPRVLRKHCQKQLPEDAHLWDVCAQRWSGPRLIQALEEKVPSQAMIEYWEQNQERIYCLYSKQDPLLQQLSPRALQLIKQGQAAEGPHALPLSHPALCAHWIEQCMSHQISPNFTPAR